MDLHSSLLLDIEPWSQETNTVRVFDAELVFAQLKAKVALLQQ